MEKNRDLKLIMISAMYENGGNTTHRLLDGHPELFVYPFESQLGTSLAADFMLSVVPFKYRWPEFPLAGSPEQDYELFFDEEMKVRLRTPERSKFKGADLDLDEKERKRTFVDLLQGKPRTRANLVNAFFRSTFASWKNLNRSGKEKAFLGYSPNMVIDTEKIFADFPDAHILHVVRNPFSGFADTKKRPFPLSLFRYTWTWSFMQYMALTYQKRYPNNFHIVRFEDTVLDPQTHLTALCQKLGLSQSETLLYPSWNGKKMEKVYPWGTIVTATTDANVATMRELSPQEHGEIKSLAAVMLKLMGYENF